MEGQWRWLNLVPSLSIFGVFLLGVLVVIPWLAGEDPQIPPVPDKPDFAAVAGQGLAGWNQIVLATALLWGAVLLLIVYSARLIFGVLDENRDEENLTQVPPRDLKLGWWSICVIGTVAFVLICWPPDCAKLSTRALPLHCAGYGRYHELIDQVSMATGVFDVTTQLYRITWANNVGVILAALSLMAASFFVLRGQENNQAIHGKTSTSVQAVEEWVTARMRQLGTLSVSSTLVLIAGIFQMQSWMHWPEFFMSNNVFPTGDAIKADFAAFVDSILRFYAAWFGLLVAAVIFPARLCLMRKASTLVKKMAQVQPAETEKAEAFLEKIRNQNDIEGYVQDYKPFLLIAAPAVFQQVIERVGT